MQEFFLFIFGPVVTALGFLIYKHPKKGQKVIETVILIQVVIIIGYMSYHNGKSNAFNQVLDLTITQSMQSSTFEKVKKSQFEKLIGDSTANSRAALSIMEVMIKMAVLDSVVTKTKLVANKSDDDAASARWYLIGGLLVLIGLYFFPYFFPDINGNPVEKKEPKKPKYQAPEESS